MLTSDPFVTVVDLLVPDAVAGRSDAVKWAGVLSKLKEDPVPDKLIRYVPPERIIDEAERSMRKTAAGRYLDLFRDGWRAFDELPAAFPSLSTGQEAVHVSWKH